MENKSYADLVEDGYTICSRCGTEYSLDQPCPEDATYYWVPSCPDCRAKCTANPTDRTWLRIISDDEVTPIDVEKLHAHSRLYHGRLANLSESELIRRAQWFDRQSNKGEAWGPRFYRDIAFNLRRQARRKP